MKNIQIKLQQVILEPATSIGPCNCKSQYSIPCVDCPSNQNNFKKVRHLTKENDSLMILDEMITGFRWDLKGAQYFFGIEPDLSTLGKQWLMAFQLLRSLVKGTL